ncbi:hypothetical protein, partial [Enterobacter roggenkampii]|uniref:hypothetical protein n=1 Tax=Enterobacter roggenkampii TaxID=1812935 RepID=UPI001953EE35
HKIITINVLPLNLLRGNISFLLFFLHFSSFSDSAGFIWPNTLANTALQASACAILAETCKTEN